MVWRMRWWMKERFFFFLLLVSLKKACLWGPIADCT